MSSISSMSGSLVRPSGGISRWVKEPFCGISHGVGAVLSVVGLIVLLTHSRPDAMSMIGVTIYGVSMIVLYTASCLVHSVHCSTRTENLLERVDYAAIFFLIAGTYTPICISALQPSWGWTILTIEWSLALLGATMVLWRGPSRRWVMLYVPMGWLVILTAVPMLRQLHSASLVLLLAGGLIYSLGAVVFIRRRPDPWPGRFNYHDLWHVMVLAGSACHFAAVMLLTAR